MARAETVDSDPFSGSQGHTKFEDPQEIFIDEISFFITRFTLSRLAFKPLTLIQRIVQLGKGVRNLSADNE